MPAYKSTNSYAERTALYANQIKFNPDRVVVIAQRHSKSHLIDEEPLKYLLTRADKVRKLQLALYNRLSLKEEQIKNIIFLFIGNRLLQSDQTFGEINDQYQDKDGLLYVMYSDMETF